MRRRQRYALICAVSLASAALLAQEPQLIPESSPRTRLLEQLRNAPPAPIHPDSRARSAQESESPEQRQSIGIDLSTGIEFVQSVPDIPAGRTQAVSSPPQPGEYPTGPEHIMAGAPFDRVEQQVGIAAVTLPSALPNSLVYPYATVYKLLIRFASGGTNYYYVCSASSLGSFHLLSAGHCIYNHDANNDGNFNDPAFAAEVWAWAAQTDQVNPIGDPDHPFGEAKATRLRTYVGWTASADLNHDMAIITLDRRVGDRTGWMGREANVAATSLNFSGYPGETPYVPSGTHFQYPGLGTGNVLSYTINRINLSAYIYGGHSGGPAWRFDGTSRWVQGVNSTSNRAGFATATRLTSEKLTNITDNLATDETALPPTARADLIEYLLSTTAKDLLINTVSPGGAVTVEYNTLNAGHATATGVVADFRLSTNNIISTSDTSLGTVFLGSISQNSYVNPTATLTIPANQPAGTYYVGWILSTSASEYSTDDNSVVIANETLTVAPAVVGHPNLQTIGPGVSKVSMLTRESFVASATIENLGNAASAATTLRYFASTDSTITTSDTPMGTAAVVALGAGGTAAYSAAVLAPTLPGTYWIGGCVDAVADETVTANQCSTGVAIALTHFTDDSLTAGVTVKAIHFDEMRTKVNALRSSRGMTAAAWTDPTLTTGSTVIKASHLQQIRDALAQVYAADGLAAPAYTNSNLASGPIRGVDITETRAAIIARP